MEDILLKLASMLNSSSLLNHIELFDNITIQIDRYFAVFIFLFAVIGNVLNIVVLSQRTLRRNPCAWLFLTSSVANLTSVLFALPSRILAGWATDPTGTHSGLCKLRAFILFTSRTIAFWLIALATVNRWLASSPNARYRQMNSLKLIRTSFYVVVVTAMGIYSQIWYCYDANLLLTPLRCYGKNAFCRLFGDAAYGCISILLPLLLMIVFGFKTLMNIHHVQTRIRPRVQISLEANTGLNIAARDQPGQWKKQDRHLFVMLVIQVIIQSILTLPQVIAKVYISATMFQVQTPLKLSVDHFVYNVALLLSFLANGMPFYIYTLCGGTVFRKPLLNVANAFWETITCHR